MSEKTKKLIKRDSESSTKNLKASREGREGRREEKRGDKVAKVNGKEVKLEVKSKAESSKGDKVKTQKVVAKVESKKVAKVEVKAEGKKVKSAKVEVKASKKEAPKAEKSKEIKVNPLKAKVEGALEAIKISATKIKYGEGTITIFTSDRLSPKQYSKLKSLAGKKLDLSTRGESWVLAYQ